jgi:hypothetical protein
MTDLQTQMSGLSEHAARLEARLGELSGQLVDLQAVMAPFLRRYVNEALRYHIRLVRVQRQIADMRCLLGDRGARKAGQADTALLRLLGAGGPSAGEQRKLTGRNRKHADPTADPDVLPEASPELKRLYAGIVARLHPALADSVEEQQSRRAAMDNANRAYLRRDELTLRATDEVLRSQPSLPAVADEQALKQQQQRISLMERLIAHLEGQVFDLQHGDAARIYRLTRRARAEERDFLAELGRALQGELRQARQELAELQRKFDQQTS